MSVWGPITPLYGTRSILWVKFHDECMEVHLSTRETATKRHQAFSAGGDEGVSTYSECSLACVSCSGASCLARPGPGPDRGANCVGRERGWLFGF